MKFRIKTITAIVWALGLAACAHVAGGTTGEAISQEEKDQEIFLSLVSSINDSGKSQAALAFLDDYLSRYPDDERALLLKADALVKNRELEAAAEIYQGLLANGVSPRAEVGLGRVKAAQARWREAASHLRIAYRHSPSDPELLNDLGYALLQVSDTEQGYRMLARAYELRPTDEVIRNNFILSAARTGRTKQVDAVLRSVDNVERVKLGLFLRQWTAQGDARQAEPTFSDDH